MDASRETKGFKDISWQYTYKTSAAGPYGRPADILHDFYIPALSLSVRYDRIAGYFRSSSLAAASQGFSAFTASQGKMRMVVGADLAEDDVAAILDGDQQRMADCLNASLGRPETWPDNVTNGVELLCWMVAKGILEVRVAFRVHLGTGKPLGLSSTEDGYVHEKWALFTDARGDRLYVSGSLNESRTALMVNAENIDVHADWWNDISRSRADDARKTFDTIWNNQNPYLRVLPLPDAVAQRLISIGKGVRHPTEIDGSTACKPEIAPPSALERLQFALIKDGPKLPGGRFVGLETAPVKPWPHQEIVARRLVQTWPYSFLLCDEVGLGKTIEAGLAIRSLYLSGLAKRILISPPAGLAEQWHREMQSKFFLPFGRALTGTAVRHQYIFPFEETRSGDGLYDPDLCIVSTGLLARKGRRAEIQKAKPFDVALVDEAHYARRKNPTTGTRAYPQYGRLYTVLRDQIKNKTRCLWLATATPMQLDWVEVFDLIGLTGRVGPFQLDPSLMGAYYEILGALVRGERVRDSDWEFLRSAISFLQRHDPFLWDYLHRFVVDGRIRMAVAQWLERGRIPLRRDQALIHRLIFSAAPLSRVMLRHTRPLLELYREEGVLSENMAQRAILPVPKIVMTPLEKKAYDQLETYCRDLITQVTNTPEGKGLFRSLGFFLSFLRLRFASSLFAIRETIRRRRDRVTATLACMQGPDDMEPDLEDLESWLSEEDDPDQRIVGSVLKNRTPETLRWERSRLEQMLRVLNDLSDTPSKMKHLLNMLEKRRIPGGRIRQTVIFTRFYDTLQDILQRLRAIDPGMLIGAYSGKGGQFVDPGTQSIRGCEREYVKRRFLREEIDILICTDAAAEGLNLQTADLLINYDLPWNPMKVEQRIGRIDRIGQKHDRVSVLNLCYADSAEQFVYDRLWERLTRAGYIVGVQQISMLPVTLEEFNDLAAGKLKPEELEARAREKIAFQKQRMKSMEIPARDLFEIYTRFRQRGARARQAPITLEAIWEALSTSNYLRDIGCTVSAEGERRFLALRGLEPVPKGTGLSIDRNLCEKGMPEREGIIHFATYGDPFFERVVKEFDGYELPGCVVRLSETVPEIDAEVVAYAAACLDDAGQPEIRLISAWKDLEGLVLAEETRAADMDLEPLKQQLHAMVRDEFEPTRAVKRLEESNQQAAKAQYIMDLLAIRSLIKPIVYEESNNFNMVLRSHLDVLIQERDQVLIADLPVETLRAIQQDLLFDVQLPTVGEKTALTLPIRFVSAAIDLGCRLADSMKRRGSEMTIGLVQGRIEREIERETRTIRGV